MKKITIFISLLFFCTKGFSQTAEKINNIKAIIEANGSAHLSTTIGKEVIKKYNKSFLSAPDEFWTKLLHEFEQNAITRYYIPLYHKNFTDQEIASLKAFYSSPLGKKLTNMTAQFDKEKAELEYQMEIIMTGILYQSVDEKGYKEGVPVENK